MNLISLSLFALMTIASFSAWAGPNWEVIHQERKDSASAFRAPYAAPTDHGPRPETTQWLNQQLENKQLAAHRSKKKPVFSSTSHASTHS